MAIRHVAHHSDAASEVSKFMTKTAQILLASVAFGALCFTADAFGSSGHDQASPYVVATQPASATAQAPGTNSLNGDACCGVTQETAATDVAAQVRLQGHRCEGSVNAQSDPEQSRPDERVWILTCANASYRVRLIPNIAAYIVRLP